MQRDKVQARDGERPLVDPNRPMSQSHKFKYWLSTGKVAVSKLEIVTSNVALVAPDRLVRQYYKFKHWLRTGKVTISKY